MTIQPQGKTKRSTFHFLLMADQSLYHKLLMRKLSGSELTIGQPKVLEYLAEHDGANQKDIATDCYIEPASLTSTLNGMESKGLVERRRLNGNRKNYYVFLTEKGREKYKLVEQAFVDMENETFACFTDEEKDVFMNLFKKLSQRIHEL